MTPPTRRPTGPSPGADGAPRQVIALGILLLARGKADGLRHFGDTRKSVLAALAPLSAFILVALGLALLAHADADVLSDLSGMAVGFLGQLVLSFEVARRWGRGAAWFRFATAFCWCQWAGPMVMAAFLILMGLLIAAGVPNEAAYAVSMLGLFGYGLWLHWFLARTALQLSTTQAAFLVLIVNAATSALVLLPQLAAVAYANGSSG